MNYYVYLVIPIGIALGLFVWSQGARIERVLLGADDAINRLCGRDRD